MLFRSDLVKFGYGLTTFESHTFLVNGGDLFEAHYGARAATGLYSKKSFESVVSGWMQGFYSGVMGIILLPPDVDVPAGMQTDLSELRRGGGVGILPP